MLFTKVRLTLVSRYRPAGWILGIGREGAMESERGKKVGGEKQQQGVEKRVMGRRNEGVKKGKKRRGRREGEGRNVVQL